MKQLSIFLLIAALFLGVSLTGSSQNFLKKVSKQVENKVTKKISGEEPKQVQNESSQDQSQESSNTSSSSSSRKKVQNTQGAGLISTPPDVKENIASAKKAVDSKSFSDARYSVRQAMQGVELEIGYNILKGLPETADGLPKDAAEDKVVSGGIGFAGLMIHRVYHTDDKELGIEIVNDAMLFSGITMFLGNSGYMAQGADENMKRVKHKGYPAVIEFDQNEGYTLSVPFGQSSLFVLNGVNYPDENAFMTAAGIFDIEKIKTELGEK